MRFLLLMLAVFLAASSARAETGAPAQDPAAAAAGLAYVQTLREQRAAAEDQIAQDAAKIAHMQVEISDLKKQLSAAPTKP